MSSPSARMPTLLARLKVHAPKPKPLIEKAQPSVLATGRPALDVQDHWQQMLLLRTARHLPNKASSPSTPPGGEDSIFLALC